MDDAFAFVNGWALSKVIGQPGYHVRMLDPKGIYPPGSFGTSQSLYYADAELAFMVTWGNQWRSPGDDLPYTEMDWVSPEELRLLASILLCEAFEGPKIRLYPVRYPLRLGARELDLTSDGVVTRMKDFLLARGADPAPHSSEHQISECLARPYDLANPAECHLERQAEFHARISTDDYLLLRGLATLIKAEMLAAHNEFWEEATIVAFIALEASFRMVLRELRRTGIENPTAEHAGAWMYATFHKPYGHGPEAMTQYFEEFYEQRVMTLHPESRFGILPYAPLLHDDYMFLCRSLRSVFAYLVTGQHSPDYLADVARFRGGDPP